MRRAQFWLVLILLVYAAATFGVILTKAPFCDEGWLASPGLNLVRSGSFGTSVLEPAGSFLVNIDRYTYWVTPLWLLASSVFYKLFGFSLTSLRSLSLVWGVIGLCSCFVIARKLTHHWPTAALASAILAFDTNFILNGATARMDMMSAMCGVTSLALFLVFHERDFTLALLLSNILAAASVFSHPNGIIAFLCLCFLTIYFDFSKIRWLHLGLAALPYLAALAAWGLYISHDPHAFVSQFVGNAKPGSRALVFHAPFAALKLEITARYLDGYSFYAPGLKKLRALPLLLYAAAFIGCLSTPAIRKDRYLRAAIWLCLLSASALFLIDGIKRSFYLVHVLTPFALLSAIWITSLWHRWRSSRWPIALSLALIFLVQLAGILSLISKQDRQRQFQPLIAFLNLHRRPGAIIMGPSELGFGLGYNPPLIDDYRLGYFTGKRPEFIVLDSNYRSLFNDLKTDNQMVYGYVTTTLAHDYTLVWQNGLYQVLSRRDDR